MKFRADRRFVCRSCCHFATAKLFETEFIPFMVEFGSESARMRLGESYYFFLIDSIRQRLAGRLESKLGYYIGGYSRFIVRPVERARDIRAGLHERSVGFFKLFFPSLPGWLGMESASKRDRTEGI